MTTVQQSIESARARYNIEQQLSPDRPGTMVHLLIKAFAENPDAPAFSSLGGTLTYRELNRLSDQFAAYLQSETDLQVGDRIALQLPNLLQYPVVAFGALKAGLILVNTNPLYSSRELLLQLKDSGARALVSLDSLIHKNLEALSQSDVEIVISTGAADLLNGARRMFLGAAIKVAGKGRKVKVQNNEVTLRHALAAGRSYRVKLHKAHSQDIALLQYTGGTTGVAKGAELTHANLISNTMQALAMLRQCGLEQGREVIIAPLPLYHVFSFVVSMVVMMHLHAHIHLIPDPRNIPALVKVLRKTPFTVFFGLNTLFAALMRHRSFSDVDFSRLKLTGSGGMALTDAIADRWLNITGCTVTEGYGLTETSPVIAINVPGHEEPGSVGVVVPSTEVRVVDDDGVAQSIDGVGELWVRGPQVMNRYWNNPSETALSKDTEGWFKTGDIVTVGEDGRLRILDRKKDMIIVSGFNVYPNEIENVVNSHPGVFESAAIGVPDEVSGESIRLFVVCSDSGVDEHALKQWCRERLSAYKVPRYIEFREDLPKSNVGKVLRARLRQKPDSL